MPLKSQAQRRFLFAAEARGEVPAGIAKRFMAETPKNVLKRLPEYVDKAKEKDGRNLRKLKRAKAKRSA